MVWKNKFSILVALIILYLSLTSASTFDKLHLSEIPFYDGIVHFGMYFGLMSAIIFENQKALAKTRNLLITSLVPLFYGILMEFLQVSLTSSREGSISDFIFNSAGIIVAMLIWLMIKQSAKETFK